MMMIRKGKWIEKLKRGNKAEPREKFLQEGKGARWFLVVTVVSWGEGEGRGR